MYVLHINSVQSVKTLAYNTRTLQSIYPTHTFCICIAFKTYAVDDLYLHIRTYKASHVHKLKVHAYAQWVRSMGVAMMANKIHYL